MTNDARSPLSLGADRLSLAGEDSLSRQAFLGLTGALTVYSLLLNAGLTLWSAQAVRQLGLLPLLAAMILPFIGTMVVGRTRSAGWALLGLHLVVVPFGILLGPVISSYVRAGAFDLVARAMVLTGCVTGIMTVLGLMYPRMFAKLGGVLFGALIALIVIRILQMFVTSLQGATWVEWMAAGIFTLLLGYRWYLASVIPANLRNAIGIALGLYLSILNLFLTILRLLSNRRN
jgi:FtsH-binding integral membrane protein